MKQAAYGSLTYNVNINDTKAQSSLRTLKGAIRSTGQEWRSSSSAMQAAGDSAAALDAKITGLNKEIELQTDYNKRLSAALKGANATTDAEKLAVMRWTNELRKSNAALNRRKSELDSARAAEIRYSTGIEKAKASHAAYTNALEASEKALVAEGRETEANAKHKEVLAAKTRNLKDELGREEKAYKLLKSSSSASGIDISKQSAIVSKAREAYLRAQEAQRKYATGLHEMQQYSKSTSEISESLANRLRSEGKNYTAMSVELKTLIGSKKGLLNQYKTEMSELSLVKSKSGETSAAYSTQAKRVNELGAKIGETDAKIRALNKHVGLSGPAINSFSDKIGGMQKKYAGVATGLAAVSRASGYATLGMAAVAKHGTSLAVELQTSFNKTKNLIVSSNTEGTKEINANMALMEKNAKSYSKEYGLTQKQIADGYQDLIKRGYSSGQAIGAMKTLIKGAIASGDDFNDVTAVSTQTLESFGLRANSTAQMAKNTSRVVNEMAYAADMTATDFQSLGKGMEYVGNTAHQAGFSISETASAMGILSNNGLESDKAGTGLRKTINSLVSPTSNATAALKKLGLSTSDFTDKNGKMKSMSDIFGILNSHMKNLSGHDRTDVFHAIFGTTGQQAGGILTDNYKALDKLNGEVERSAKDDYIGNLAQKNLKTSQNQLRIFQTTLQALEIEFGKVILPYITKGAKALTIIMDKFDKLNPSAKKAIASVALLVPAIGLVSGAVAAFIRNSGTIASVVSKLFSTNKVDTASASKIAVAKIDEQTAAVQALADAWASAGKAAGAEASEVAGGVGGGKAGKAASKAESEVESVGTREEYQAAKKSGSKMSVLKRMAKGKVTTEDAEAISSRVGRIGTTGSKLGKVARFTGGVAKRVPWLQVGLSGLNLIGTNKKNVGTKVGKTAGQLGGTLVGGAIGGGIGGIAGGAIGTMFGPAGTVVGAKLGQTAGSLAGSWIGGSKGNDWGGKLGEKIQKSMKNFKMPKMSTITKSVGDWFGGIGKWIGKLKLPSINFGKMFKGFKMPNIGKMFKNFKMPKISGISKWFSGLFKGLKVPSLSSIGKSISSAFGKLFSDLGKTGIGKSIGRMLSGIGKTMSGWAKGIGKFFAPAVKAIQAPFIKIGKWFKTSPVGKSIATIGKDIAGAVRGIGKFIAAIGAIGAKLAKIGLTKLFNGIGKAVKGMGKFFTDVGKTIKRWASDVRRTIDNMVKPIQKTMGKIGSGISKAWSGALKNVTKFVKNIYNTATRWIGKMLSPLARAWKSISSTAARWWRSISRTVGSWAHDIWSTVTRWIGKLLSPVAKAWQSVSRTAARWWRSISHTIGSWVYNIYTSVTKWFNKILSPVARLWKNVSSTIGGWVKSIWRNISNFGNNMASFFKKLPGRISSALRGAWHGIWNSMAGIVNNGVIHPVVNGWNAVADAINGVERKIGVGKSFRLGTASYGSAKLSTYAKGTEGGPALVNDAKGKYWREAYKLPDGRMGMFPNKRNIIVNLPKGTQIAKGEDARVAQPYIEHNQSIPAFASATGWLDGIGSAIGGAVHGVGKWFSGVETKASKLIDNLGKMIKSPAKYLSAMIASPLNGLAKSGGLVGKAIGMTGDIVVNTLTSWFKKMLQAGQDEQLVGNVKLGGSVASRARALAKAFKQGYPAAQDGGIAGILGNWIIESNLTPTAIDPLDHGTGLGQWTFTRETGLRNWLRRHGYAWDSAAGQIGYALNEPGMNGELKAVLRMTSPVAAARRFFAGWESGGAMNGTGGARESNASAAYRYIRGMEHGGLVDKAQTINIAEKNKPEMVVSLTDKDAAIRQLKQSINYLESGSVANSSSSSNSVDNSVLSELVSLQQQTNALLQALLGSANTPNVAVITDQSIYDSVKRQQKSSDVYNKLIN